MLSIRRLGPVRPFAGAGFILLAGLALFFGLASALLPPWFVFAVLLVPAVAALMLVRPEYALIACIALVCGLIHPGLVPRIPAFGGALAAADAVLVMLALYAVWRFATQDHSNPAEAPILKVRLLAVSLGLFGITLAIAVVTSLTLRGLNPSHVLGETRDLVYLLMLPIALVILRERERQRRFVIALVVLGCLFSVGQILQGVFKVPVFGAQGMSALETLGRRDDATTRANTLGLNVIVFALLLTVGAYVVGSMRKPVFFAVAVLLFVGIVLTFGRTTFAAVLICATLLVWWLNPKKLPWLAVLLVIVVAAGSALAWSLKPESFASVVYRMTTIGEEIDYGYSAQWRFWEFESMLPHLQQHPLTGIGLGADYKGLKGSSARPELNRYMHNAYLYMAGKMGLPALALLLLSMTTIFAIGRGSAKSSTVPWVRVVGAASAAMMIRFLLASITEPHLMSDYGLVLIAIAGALVVLGAQSSALAGKSTSTALDGGTGSTGSARRSAFASPANDVDASMRSGSEPAHANPPTRQAKR